MTYAQDRRIIDIDAHIMEPKGWLHSFAPFSVHDAIPELGTNDQVLEDLLLAAELGFAERGANGNEMIDAERDFMAMPRKGWMSLGGWDAAERSRALDLLGFEYQLIFPTGSFVQVMQTPIPARIEATRAMNRGLQAFCDDPRLSATAYLPFEHGPDVALAFVAEAVASHAGGVMIDSIPADHSQSPTHPDFDVVWSALQEANIAVFLHIGGDQNYRPVRRSFFNNGREMAHFRSDAPGDALSFMAVGYPAELFIASLVYDGVLEKFPLLRFGITELGATWLPSFLHFIDTGLRSFRSIQDLSHLSMRPSDYVRRQVVVSPFAGEDVGWIIEQAGSEMVAFSSDYPHHEGTDDPIRRFEASMPNMGPEVSRAFYCDNAKRLLAL